MSHHRHHHSSGSCRQDNTSAVTATTSTTPTAVRQQQQHRGGESSPVWQVSPELSRAGDWLGSAALSAAAAIQFNIRMVSPTSDPSVCVVRRECAGVSVGGPCSVSVSVRVWLSAEVGCWVSVLPPSPPSPLSPCTHMTT